MKLDSKRAESAWNPEANVPYHLRSDRKKTDHAVALAYAEKGWGGHETRKDWENDIRYHGPFAIQATK